METLDNRAGVECQATQDKVVLAESVVDQDSLDCLVIAVVLASARLAIVDILDTVGP